jgi:4-hydroxy-3-polyprenylbenzoate decarboxylase
LAFPHEAPLPHLESNMASVPNDLREFIAALDAAGELKRIRTPVDPVLEITEIADRVVKGGGPALLFENPVGSEFPVLINAFASWRRVSIALGGRKIEEVAEEIKSLTKIAPPRGFGEIVGLGAKALGLYQAIPKTSRGTAPCQEVVMDPPDLTKLPVLKCWPDDGGRYITLPMVFSKDPVTGRRNCGMYRIQVFDAETTAMHWQIHKVGARHYGELEEMKKPGVIQPGPPPKSPPPERMEVAVAVGADPLTIYSATAPLPEEIDEMLFSGFLRKRPVEMVKCRTVDLEVPAQSEFVLEGYVTPYERRTEGPFGDHTGFYSLADEYPVFHITAITHRRDPVYVTTVVGRPPMEDGWLGKMTERLFLPLLQTQLPELVDMNLPVDAIFHNLAIVSIRKRFPGHAFRVMNALWGMGQMSLTKCIIVLDHDADVQNMGEVLWRVGNNIDPERDVQFVRGPIDVLDHASRGLGFGSKMGIDATRKWPNEGFDREWPDELRMTDEVKSRVDKLWPNLGLDQRMNPKVHPDQWREKG